jgi:hypothetical protein
MFVPLQQLSRIRLWSLLPCMYRMITACHTHRKLSAAPGCQIYSNSRMFHVPPYLPTFGFYEFKCLISVLWWLLDIFLHHPDRAWVLSESSCVKFSQRNAHLFPYTYTHHGWVLTYPSVCSIQISSDHHLLFKASTNSMIFWWMIHSTWASL